MKGHPFDLVLFGATGDLALRKLLPALYNMQREPEFADARLIATAPEPMSTEQYAAQISAEVPRFFATGEFDRAAWQTFLTRIRYVQADACAAPDFARFGEFLSHAPERARVFYLATAPALFTPICRNLAAGGLVTPQSRVVLEKPLGRDLASSCRINDAVGEIFREEQIYRIDHYLGKETVQNLLALRFGNTLFEPIWSRAWIRDVQITLAEQVGVENRGEFYESTGALRDMVQNHLLQCLCIVAMEPPASIDADAVRDAKLQVLRALRPFDPAGVQARTVRGQYRAGAIEGQPVPGYFDERGIDAHSRTETFVAIKAEVDNWRWAGTPFYLRTGKRLPARHAQIVVNFRAVPHSIFDGHPLAPRANQLIIRLQPDDGLTLQVNAKTPGDRMQLRPMTLNLSFHDNGTGRRLDAYERLLMDVVRGRLALFVRRDELEAAWTWIEPILAGWQEQGDAPKPYTAGTWGPAASSALIGRDAMAWQEEV
jgi:glucose-6-phosphate 1-dehydrogenase